MGEKKTEKEKVRKQKLLKTTPEQQQDQQQQQQQQPPPHDEPPYLGPEVHVLLLHEIPRLVLEQAVFAGDTEKVIVALSSRALVREEGHGRVQLLAVLAKNLGVQGEGASG